MSLETGALKVGREPEHLRYDPILTNAPPKKKGGWKGWDPEPAKIRLNNRSAKISTKMPA